MTTNTNPAADDGGARQSCSWQNDAGLSTSTAATQVADAERALVAALLREPEAYTRVDPNALYDPKHRQIHAAIAKICQAGRQPTIQSLAATLPADFEDGAPVIAHLWAYYTEAVEYELAVDDFVEAVADLAARRTREARAGFITPAEWPDATPPPVRFLAAGRIPRGDVTTLSGDGGAGKTDIVVQLAANVARGAPEWLGHSIENGPVVFISAEEPEREIQRRLVIHASRDGYDVHTLSDLHLWFPDDVADTALGAADKHGVLRATPLFDRLRKVIDTVQPVLVTVDNVAATFVGNYIDRGHARQYVNLWRAVARGPFEPAVVLLDHPSLSGMNSGTGRAGNSDWRNSVRTALYLRAVDTESDRGIRILQTTKSNYGPTGNVVRLRWHAGGFALEPQPTSVHMLAQEAECEATFLRLLDGCTAQGRMVSASGGANYAPHLFAKSPGANGFSKSALASAMERLFQSGRIQLGQYGPPSRRRSRIERNGP